MGPCAAVSALGVCAALCAFAAEPPKLRIPRVTQAPKLEEFLDGASPGAGVRVSGFRQYQPGDGTPASQETTAYLSYDDRNLYAVFVCREEPGKVRARMSKREDFEGDDHVILILDTFHDHHRAYILAVNPLGVQFDGTFTEGQGEPESSFDTLWYSEGRLTAAGFVVWTAVPFKSLRFPNSPVQSWGITVARLIARQNELSTWPYLTQRVSSFAGQMADLEGLERISPGRNLQLIPYGMFARTRYLDTEAPAFRRETEARAGLDAKAVLRDALTLDVALNPDFSQVESDEPQVTVNRRYEVFFPEKRPLFIENSGIFETPINLKGFYEPALSLFFSRRIADPQYGLRLTGKLGPWVVGALAIDDRAAGEGEAAEHGPPRNGRAGIGVLRLRRDFTGQSSVGLLVTSRDRGSSFNRVFSLDTRLRLNPNWTVSGQLLRSYTREEGGGRLAGPAYYARLEHQGRHLHYFSRYLDFSPDFRAPLGFIRRVDIRQTEHFAGYRWLPERRRLVRLDVNAAVLANWNRQGRVQDWTGGAGFEVEFPGPTILGGGHNQNYELYEGRSFRENSTGLSATTRRWRWLELKGQHVAGKSVNYHPAAPLAPSSANSAESQAGFTLRPTARLRAGQTYIYSRLSSRRDRASIFNNHILRSKVNYQFTRPLSLRAILDYNAVLPNTSLVDLERSKRFTADLLLTYLVNPGTAFYVGYSDRYDNLELLPGAPPMLRRIGPPRLATGRQLFVKLSYLLRF